MRGIIIVFFVSVVCVYALKSLIHKIRHGSSCCGEKEASEKRIRVKDRRTSHYGYSYRFLVDGMHCAACVRRVENALNALGDVLAKANLSQKTVQVFCKNQPNISVFENAITQAGDTVLSVTEEKK